MWGLNISNWPMNKYCVILHAVFDTFLSTPSYVCLLNIVLNRSEANNILLSCSQSLFYKIYRLFPGVRMLTTMVGRFCREMFLQNIHVDFPVIQSCCISKTVQCRLSHDDVIKWKHFRVTGHMCGEFTGPRWIPRTKASDFDVFLPAPE